MAPYTTTMTKSNQVTLTKPAREFLGVKAGEKLIIEKNDDHTITIRRRLTDEEFLKKIDTMKSDKTKKIIKSGAYKDVDSFRNLSSYKEELLREYED